MAASPDEQVIGVDVSDAWSRFKDRLHAFALRRVGSAAEAEDVVQDALMRLLQHQDRIETDRLAPWLFRTARNAVIDRQRQAGRDSVVVEEATAQPAAAAPEEPGAGLAACVRPLLAMLSAEDRSILEEVELASRSPTDLARSMGVPPSTVKSRVRRARQRLREQFDRCCTIELDGRGGPHDFTPRGDPQYPDCNGCD